MKANEAPETYPIQFKDKIDEYLWKEHHILGGCCSSIEEMKYSVAREVAEKLTDAFIEKAAEWQRKELCNYFDAPREDFERFIEDFRKAMSEKCNVSNHVFIKGDVIKNKVTEKQYLVIKVESNTFLLGDAICPQFGYKKEVSISPLYVFVKHLSEKEFKDIMNRCV